MAWPCNLSPNTLGPRRSCRGSTDLRHGVEYCPNGFTSVVPRFNSYLLMHRSIYVTSMSRCFCNVVASETLLTSREIRPRRKGNLVVSLGGWRYLLVSPQSLGKHEVGVAQLLSRGRCSFKSNQKRRGCFVGSVQLSGHGYHWALAMHPRQRVHLQRCQ